ncbi:MAG TPA: type I methionyl aminopeptidase [Bacteroidota bacterium]|nr:type I methionyl aminopeptidase [Bacteroidota bacterium]
MRTKKISAGMSAGIQKTSREIELMKESCTIVARVLRHLGTMIRPGISTLELDVAAEEFIRMEGGVPAFKGYGPDSRNLFPATLCTSVDDEVVHGIPGKRKLVEGEIVSIDVGVKKNGYFGDGAWTFPVGEISEEKARLMRVTREALMDGIGRTVVGNRVHDISAAIQKRVETAGFSVVRDLVGHGIGTKLHEEPAVPNFGNPGTGMSLEEGMTLAIEPMVNYGSYRVVVDPDRWTIRTSDHQPSAHFEHTVLVTGGEAMILTA